MNLIFTKTNKLKQITKSRQNLLKGATFNDCLDDQKATHFLVTSEENIVGCGSYIFADKNIIIYAVIATNTNIQEEIIKYIKKITKHFNCTYKIKV